MKKINYVVANLNDIMSLNKDVDIDLLDQVVIGTTWIEYISVLYLAQKYRNHCQASGNFVSTIDTMDLQLDQVDLIPVWYVHEQELYIPKSFRDNLKKCAKSTRTIGFIHIWSRKSVRVDPYKMDEGWAHVVLFLYTKKGNSLEIFDPNGKETVRYGAFHLSIKQLVESAFNKKIKRVNHQNNIFNITPDVELKVDPAGYCAYWCAWYADIRLSNPSYSMTKVKNLAKSNKVQSKFIRKYALFIQTISQLAYHLINTLGSNDPELSREIVKMGIAQLISGETFA